MLIGQSTTPRPTTIEQLLGAQTIARLDRLDLLSRKILSGTLPGERRSKRRGRSVEFDDFRDYTPGDDLRHIDWNIYARLDRLFIKLFREEQDLSLHLVVDATASMDAGNPNKLVYAHGLAMALAYVGVVNQNRVSVSTFDAPGPGRPAVRALMPVRGRTAVRRIGGFLLEGLRETRSPGGGADPGEVLVTALRAAARTNAGRGIVVVISDFLCPSGCAPGLAYLGAACMSGVMDAYCVQVNSPGEADPEQEAAAGLFGDLRLTDAETGRAAEVTVTPDSVRDYRAARAAYKDALHAECASRGIAHAEVSTRTPIEALVLGTLRRGGLLR
mgnify:CR=1 FL=1